MTASAPRNCRLSRYLSQNRTHAFVLNEAKKNRSASGGRGPRFFGLLDVCHSEDFTRRENDKNGGQQLAAANSPRGKSSSKTNSRRSSSLSVLTSVGRRIRFVAVTTNSGFFRTRSWLSSLIVRDASFTWIMQAGPKKTLQGNTRFREPERSVNLLGECVDSASAYLSRYVWMNKSYAEVGRYYD